MERIEEHIIQQLRLQLKLATSKEAYELQSLALELMERQVMPMLETIVQQYIGPDEVVEIDRLVVDVGQIPAANFAAVWPEKVATAFREALTGELARQEVLQTPRKRRDEADAESLLHFLRTGQVRWHVRTRAFDPDALLRAAIAAHPDWVHRVMSPLLAQRQVRDRLALQFSQETLQRLIELLRPELIGYADTLAVTVRALAAHHPFLPRGQARQEAFALSWLLSWLAEGVPSEIPGAKADPEAFLEPLLAFAERELPPGQQSKVTAARQKRENDLLTRPEGSSLNDDFALLGQFLRGAAIARDAVLALLDRLMRRVPLRLKAWLLRELQEPLALDRLLQLLPFSQLLRILGLLRPGLDVGFEAVLSHFQKVMAIVSASPQPADALTDDQSQFALMRLMLAGLAAGQKLPFAGAGMDAWASILVRSIHQASEIPMDDRGLEIHRIRQMIASADWASLMQFVASLRSTKKAWTQAMLALLLEWAAKDRTWMEFVREFLREAILDLLAGEAEVLLIDDLLAELREKCLASSPRMKMIWLEIEDIAARGLASGEASTPNSNSSAQPDSQDSQQPAGDSEATDLSLPNARRPKPQSTLLPPETAFPEPPDEAGYYVENAGIVLLNPFFQPCFEELGMMAAGEFADEEAQEDAAMLLAFLASGVTEVSEAQLPLIKALVGIPLDRPIRRQVDLSEAAYAEADNLIAAANEHWEKAGKLTPDQFRASFLMREGRLKLIESGWELKVDRWTIDVLLDFMPWGYATIRLPWMTKLMSVDW